MMKLFPRFLLFLTLLSLVSCTITKRKYTGGFSISWNKKVPDVNVTSPSKPIYRAQNKIALANGVLRKTVVSTNSVKAVNHPEAKRELVKSVAANLSSPAYSPKPMHVESVKARNRDNGLTGFEIGALNIICTALLIFFGNIGYAVFVIGLFLIFLFLFISGTIYSFMGLDRNDKHRGLGLIGILIEAGVLTALIKWG